jgi:hypothetical protein
MQYILSSSQRYQPSPSNGVHNGFAFECATRHHSTYTLRYRTLCMLTLMETPYIVKSSLMCDDIRKSHARPATAIQAGNRSRVSLHHFGWKRRQSAGLQRRAICQSLRAPAVVHPSTQFEQQQPRILPAHCGCVWPDATVQQRLYCVSCIA